MSHIALVQQTLESLLPVADSLAGQFYDRLFELDPSLRPLFKHDPAEQRKKFIDMLRAMIQGLDRLQTILPDVHELGRRHASYGVKPEHYPTVGAALLWALDQKLDRPLSPEARTAWIETYALLTAAMQAGANT